MLRYLLFSNYLSGISFRKNIPFIQPGIEINITNTVIRRLDQVVNQRYIIRRTFDKAIIVLHNNIRHNCTKVGIIDDMH